VKRVPTVLLVLALVLVLGILSVWLLSDEGQPEVNPDSNEAQGTSLTATGVSVVEISVPNAGEVSPEQPLLGNIILADYARPDLSPEHDLTLMSRLMDNSVLLLKSAANRPLGCNEDWADLLRGANGAHERFLPDQHVGLNADGQLIDRWGTPLFFHALGEGRYELRSAGPDQKLWTADDIHRNADGSFRRGPALNTPSLLDSSASE